MKLQILIVDDDKDICSELKAYLEPHGFNVFNAHHGDQMWRQLKTHLINLVVLDIMLPGTDGIKLCQQLRTQSSVPIIMLSAAGSEGDRVASLEIGADDFLAKPFSARELLARIKALLRRSSGLLAKERDAFENINMPRVRFAHWQLDRARRVLIDEKGVSVSLSQREFEILSAFIMRPKHILTRDQLIEYTRGLEASPFDRSIDVQIGRLRKKIEIDPKKPKIITTVRGGGYQFNVDVNPISIENHC